MIAGTIYGVALNDRDQHPHLAGAFSEPPYQKPPQRPVLYIKPHPCLMGPCGVIPVPSDLEQVEVAATLALLIGRDACRIKPEKALDHVGGVCLALDVSEPCDSYYRPPVRQRCRDGFLRLSTPVRFEASLLNYAIETVVDEILVHSWSPHRLIRDPASLIAEISAFMTLAAGDLLLIGLAHDAPRLAAGSRISVRCGRAAPLSARLEKEMVP
jgi:5-oxopent-3-ene-1,2,5-tricarboxylate decarboxylase / 2-hydroxyhepta-2,4-diene-1,7-dioate isomerase